MDFYFFNLINELFNYIKGYQLGRRVVGLNGFEVVGGMEEV